jgi:predicted esterase
VQGLVDQEVARGVRPSRIVVGGFSQGCVVSLLLGLGGRYAGRVGGVVGLSGALCSGGTIERAKGEEAWRKGEMGGDGGRVKGGEGRADKTKMRTAFFLAHGTKDFLIPMRFYRKTKERLGRLLGEGTDGVGDGRLECHDYEGMGHGTCGQEFLDLCGFLERVVPA